MTHFELIQAGSKLSLYAQSNLYPIQTSTNLLNGMFEMPFDFAGKVDPSASVSGQMTVSVEDLKSGLDHIDRLIQKRLDIRRYPMIRVKLLAITKCASENYFTGVGEISFHGITRRIEEKLTITVLD